MNLATSEAQIRQLKYIASIEMGQSPPSTEYSLQPESGLPFLQGTADFGATHPKPRVYCDTPTKIARLNDILFSVRAPVGELNIADQVYGIGRGLCAVTCSDQLDQRFAWWALHLSRIQLAYVATGSTYEAVAVEDVANILIPYFPLATQRAIAAYLDRETAKIDAMIDAKQRLLALLAEKRRALITHAVTRGLNPAAPMRDSGVPWIGEVPEGWEIRRSKWLFRERDERSTTGEEILLSLRMERGLVPHNEVSEKQTRPEELVGYKKTSQHEIVVNRMRAASGLVAVSPQEGLVSPDYAVFQALPSANPYYYTHLFKTELLQSVFRSESTGLGTGSSGFLRLYSDSFLSLWFPYPSLREQKEIVTQIEVETQAIDRLRSNTQTSINLLHERRAALIATAVTGQIQVTG